MHKEGLLIWMVSVDGMLCGILGGKLGDIHGDIHGFDGRLWR